MGSGTRGGLAEVVTRKKPAGGYRFLTVGELCMSWALYREERISALALRAYFAAHEMAARRCLLEPRRSPHFTREELAELLGGVGPAKVRAALHELAAVRLLTLTDRALEFAKKPADLAGELPACLGPMLAAFKSPARAVPVPRRVLRMLAGRAGRGLVATTLAHVLRCMRFLRDRGCVTVGLCRPRWVADVFGVSLAAVKDARAQLETEGMLLREETALWVRRRWGSRVTLNPTWCIAETATASVTEPKSGPSVPVSDPKSGLSDSELEPSSTYRNQKPALGGPDGFSGRQRKPQEPSLYRVEPEDLRNVGRLERLYRQAVERKLAEGSESGFYDFAALAERARRVGRNPGAVFVTLLREKRWAFITNADEDAALRRVKAHRDPQPEPARPRPQPHFDPEELRRAELRRQYEELIRRDPSLRAS
jgi:hypothetical protein